MKIILVITSKFCISSSLDYKAINCLKLFKFSTECTTFTNKPESHAIHVNYIRSIFPSDVAQYIVLKKQYYIRNIKYSTIKMVLNLITAAHLGSNYHYLSI